jgi:hypothetical protein
MSITAATFLAAFLGCLLLALVRSPIFGLYAYLATFYLHPVSRWWGAGLPDLRWSFIAALVTLVAVLRMPQTPQRPGWLTSAAAWYLLLMSVWMWIQNAWAISPVDHLDASLLFTKYLVLFILMYRLLDTESSIWQFLRAHVLGCVYLGWLALMAPDSGRLDGVGGPGIAEANALAMHSGTAAFAAAALLFHGPAWSRAMGLLSLPLILNTIIQTESRGGFLAIAASGLVFLYFMPSRARRYGIALGVAGMVALLPAVPASFWERISTVRDVTQEEAEVDMSTRSRLALMEAQIQMFTRYPHGAGHRGTAYLSPQYLSDEYLTFADNDPTKQRLRSSHNTFLTVLVEQGVPGVILVATVLLWIARTLRTVRRSLLATPSPGLQLLSATTAATLSVVLIAGLFTDYFKAEVFVWGISLLAAIRVLPHLRSVEQALTPRAVEEADKPAAKASWGHAT